MWSKRFLKAEHVLAEGKQQIALENTGITFERPARKIARVDARIDINRSKANPAEQDCGYRQPAQTNFYVDVCTNAVWEMSLDEPFTTFVEAKGVKPGMNVSYMKRVEHVDVTNQGPIPAPEEVCLPAVYVPENFKWKQTAII